MKQLFYQSGKLYARLTEGKQEYYYEDGTLKTVQNFNGETVLYHPNGRLKRKCYFENGKRIGPDQFWDEEGVLLDG